MTQEKKSDYKELTLDDVKELLIELENTPHKGNVIYTDDIEMLKEFDRLMKKRAEEFLNDPRTNGRVGDKDEGLS